MTHYILERTLDTMQETTEKLVIFFPVALQSILNQMRPRVE